MAGQEIILRLSTGPGPQGNTCCDLCYWGDPVISIGDVPKLATEREWRQLEQQAIASARSALMGKADPASGAFDLHSRDQRFGAGIALGSQGLTDSVFAFSDGSRDLIYRGFACDLDEEPVGGVERGKPYNIACDGQSFAYRIEFD